MKTREGTQARVPMRPAATDNSAHFEAGTMKQTTPTDASAGIPWPLLAVGSAVVLWLMPRFLRQSLLAAAVPLIIGTVSAAIGPELREH